MKKTLGRKRGRVIVAVLLITFLCIVPLSTGTVLANEFSSINISLFYRVRLEILGQSAKGLYYINLFDRYTGEITQTVVNHPSLMVESFSVLKAWEPYLDAFVNGRGDEVRITDKQIQIVSEYLDHLGEWVSPELKSVLDTERVAWPLEATAGMTMNEAWNYINQDPRFSWPEASSTASSATLESFSPELASWPLPEIPQLSMVFNPEVWEHVTWHNGVAPSWELKHRSLYDCVVTIPRFVSDPYSYFDTGEKFLGELPYEARFAKFSEFMLYAVYKPLYISFDPNGVAPQNEQLFIVYPGRDTAACIEQSEALFGNVHVSSESQP